MRTSTRAAAAGAAFCAGLLAALPSARAQDCAPQTMIAALNLEPAIDKKEEYVPVAINGVKKLMLLDTGGAMTEVTTEAADELHMVRRHGNFRLYNIYGESSDQFVEGSLEVGPLKAQGVALAIAPGAHVFGEDYELAGVLAPDILKHYDIDVDFGGDTLKLFAPDHCFGKVIYWRPDRVAVIPMRVLHSGHIMIQVALDGEPVIAILDTGAFFTTLALPVAQTQFRLHVGDKDTPATGNLTGKPNSFTYRHVFRSLAFEGIAVSNPTVEVIPDLLHQVATDAALPPTGTRIGDPKKLEGNASMLIGMNILRHFHIYIAYQEQRLYVTPTVEHPVLPPTAEEPPQAVPAHLSLRAER
jgi:aspartyl protease